MAYPRKVPTDQVEYAIRQFRDGTWTLTECAVHCGCDKAHMSRILHGQKRQEAMVLVDPSSCAPTYQAPTRTTACPFCDGGNTWVKYEGRMDTLGRVTFSCPNCGRAAVA